MQSILIMKGTRLYFKLRSVNSNYEANVEKCPTNITKPRNTRGVQYADNNYVAHKRNAHCSSGRVVCIMFTNIPRLLTP